MKFFAPLALLAVANGAQLEAEWGGYGGYGLRSYGRGYGGRSYGGYGGYRRGYGGYGRGYGRRGGYGW